MRTVGIIAEYNPFHTGHAYHIQKAKELSGADYAVVVMSPDFVQRGEPAVFDKYTRAHMALLNGADLVVELPVCYATGSAEYFAEGAVALLDRLGVVDALCFGAEQADPELFSRVAAVLSKEPLPYKERLREQLRLGDTFPRARSKALIHCLCMNDAVSCTPDPCRDGGEKEWDPQALSAFLNAPNNILGLEYCRALLAQKSAILPLPISRDGSDFNSVSLSDGYCSASALRRGIADGTPDDLLSRYIPENCRRLFAAAKSRAVTSEELLPFLVQKLLSCDSFDSVFDLSPELSDRIRSLRCSCIGKPYGHVITSLKTRQLTEAHIRRALLHLVLDLRSEDVLDFRANGTVFYARVLGLKRSASPLLHAIRRSCSVPFLTKPAHALRSLDGRSAQMWKQDLFASHLYRGILAGRTHAEFHSEYEISPLVL